MILNHFK